jgi:HK97 gp10 family phage protein
MINATVTGIPDLKEALRGIVPKLRVRALRNALAAGARVVQKAARAATPVISITAPAVRKGYRKPGTVRQAISVRTSRVARAAGNVGVFVNVRPAKGARFKTTGHNVLGIKFKTRAQTRISQRGAKSPNDPYYWRWLQFGAKHMKGSKFLEAGAQKLPQALQVFLQKIGPAIEKLNHPKAPAP